MAKDVSPERLELRKRAIQLARKAGKPWRDIGKDERRAFVKRARIAGANASDTKVPPAREPDPARKAAKAAATKEGRKWRELSREDRKKYIAQARRA